MKKLLILLLSVLICAGLLIGCDSCTPADSGNENGGENGSNSGANNGNSGNNGNIGNLPPFGDGGEIDLPILPYE